ncbi:MAG: alpha/beta hydrolase family protein [Chthoniobacterales bacterium]
MAFLSPVHSHYERLRNEARAASRSHLLPTSLEEWKEQVALLRQTLKDRLHLPKADSPPELETHGEIQMTGYRIQRVSFLSAPDICVTGNLYIPDGEGKFSAVLNMHGHWRQGKIAAKIQARGHLLALHGIVTLSVDAAGAGERGDEERVWQYHGAAKAGELFLSGDSLLGFQVRDNIRALDVLASLPFVNPDKIGVTGASGGGNQATWLSAIDERVKVAVPVSSMGSFEAYVTRRNCMCETLPGGLSFAEQWHLLGAIAPRPLLVLNARYDQPAFGTEALEFTCRHAEHIYDLYGAAKHFDWQALEMEHGFNPPALEAMLGWMRHYLCDAPSAEPLPLPEWTTLPEEELLCFEKGKRPQACSYAANRQTISTSLGASSNTADPSELASIIGWQESG